MIIHWWLLSNKRELSVGASNRVRPEILQSKHELKHKRHIVVMEKDDVKANKGRGQRQDM
jgi:hypothetical protein